MRIFSFGFGLLFLIPPVFALLGVTRLMASAVSGNADLSELGVGAGDLAYFLLLGIVGGIMVHYGAHNGEAAKSSHDETDGNMPAEDMAAVVTDAYHFFSEGRLHDDRARIFEAILNMRNFAAVQSGKVPVPSEEKDRVLSVAADDDHGCLAVLAFGILWLDLGDRRVELEDAGNFAVVTGTIYDTVSSRAATAVSTDLTRMRLMAMRLMAMR